MSSTSICSRKRKEPTRRSERIKKLEAKSETQIPHIPDEILATILSKLPVKSLLRFRCVSKRWDFLISDPEFNLSTSKQQVIVVSNYSSSDCSVHLINDEALSVEVPKPKQLKLRGRKLNWRLTIRGSCNGLVLLSNTVDLVLWNPSTRCCCQKVLSHKHLKTFDQDHSASGLCYDSSTDDYKVVMACWRQIGARDDDKVMVGSFRNKTWTEVCFPYDKRCIEAGPTVNERLHWLVRKNTSITYDRIFSPVGFDQQTNEFVELPMPQNMKRKLVIGLGALDGCLSLALLTTRTRVYETQVEVLLMKKYGDQASWTSLFVISVVDQWRSHIWVPLCFTKNAEMLMQWEEPCVQGIVAYNRELKFCRNIPIATKNCVYEIKAATFVESLVSPPYYNWEEEEEYTEIFLSGSTKKWKREQGYVAFKVIDS